MSFFPIGDFHIESMDQAKVFADYVNLRPEDVVVLLGDIINFSHSFWTASKDVSYEERVKNIPKDIRIWEKFVASVKKKTIYYMGTHEMFPLRFILKMCPSLKPRIWSRYVYIPDDLEIIPIGSKNNPIFVTGLHVLDNIHPRESEEFVQRKEIVEKWIEDKTASFSLESPEKTYVCTHDPTDLFYKNMGYNAITKMLTKLSPRIHYHAHIHSNIRNTIAEGTPSVNRSFVALSRLEPNTLEPSTAEIRSLYIRDI